jgi:hypothetical protein
VLRVAPAVPQLVEERMTGVLPNTHLAEYILEGPPPIMIGKALDNYSCVTVHRSFYSGFSMGLGETLQLVAQQEYRGL